MTKHQVYLGLGSNLGNREAVLLQAIKLIDERVGQVLRRSSFIAVCCETELSPRQVLQTTQQIERDLGKRKCHATKRQKTINYQDRPIDIDILLYDDLIVDEPDLKIPHPLMHQREFVMRPLNEIREPQSL